MRKSFASIILFTLIFSGCSRLKFAYEMMPWLLERQAKKYVSSLTPEQLAKLKEETKTYAEWHRKEMLPAYGAALRTLASGMATSTTAKDSVMLVAPLLNGLYSATVEPLYLPSAELLASMDETQINKMEKALEKKVAEDEKNYLGDEAAVFARRVERLKDSLEDYFGPLNEVQLKHLETLCREFPMPYAAWIRDRRDRAATLVAMLREKKGTLVLQAHLRDWWTKARSAGKKREDYQWDEDQMRHFVDSIFLMLTPAQRLHASKKLLELAAQLDEIAKAPIPAPKPTAAPPAPTPIPTEAPTAQP